jgi:type I restriction enzyme S subunit
MSVNNEFDNLVRLGDYITQRRDKNDNLDVPIRGVTNSGFIPPKQLDADTSLYNVFYKNDFVFNPARMELNSISLNLEYEQAICSSLYEIFYVNNTEELLPEYLNLFIKRDEFARFCWYDAIGSARNYFRVANLQEILFPLLDIDIQKELVDTYNGLKALAEQNEALITPLTEACQAYIVDCKKKHPEVELGGYIEEVKTINIARKCTFLRGVGNQGFIDPRQQRTNESLNKCTIFHKGDLVYNPSVLFAGAIALNSDFDEAICTEEYVVFHSKDAKILLPEFIFLWLKRKEMGRYFWFSNMDSVRNRIYFEDTCKIGIPLPPPEVQQAIVDIYNCAQEAKKIAKEAREKMKNLCPALVQRAINE